MHFIIIILFFVSLIFPDTISDESIYNDMKVEFIDFYKLHYLEEDYDSAIYYVDYFKNYLYSSPKNKEEAYYMLANALSKANMMKFRNNSGLMSMNDIYEVESSIYQISSYLAHSISKDCYTGDIIYLQPKDKITSEWGHLALHYFYNGEIERAKNALKQGRHYGGFYDELLDLGYNYLVGCEKESILFTNGDLDTYSIMYLQLVNGFRDDVIVMNSSLLNTDWYFNHFLNKHPQLVKPNFQIDNAILDFNNHADDLDSYYKLYIERSFICKTDSVRLENINYWNNLLLASENLINGVDIDVTPWENNELISFVDNIKSNKNHLYLYENGYYSLFEDEQCELMIDDTYFNIVIPWEDITQSNINILKIIYDNYNSRNIYFSDDPQSFTGLIPYVVTEGVVSSFNKESFYNFNLYKTYDNLKNNYNINFNSKDYLCDDEYRRKSARYIYLYSRYIYEYIDREIDIYDFSNLKDNNNDLKDIKNLKVMVNSLKQITSEFEITYGIDSDFYIAILHYDIDLYYLIKNKFIKSEYYLNSPNDIKEGFNTYFYDIEKYLKPYSDI